MIYAVFSSVGQIGQAVNSTSRCYGIAIAGCSRSMNSRGRFINAISDRVLSAFVPLLEVLPEYQRRGIGSTLVETMLAQLGDLYMVDLVADAEPHIPSAAGESCGGVAPRDVEDISPDLSCLGGWR